MVADTVHSAGNVVCRGTCHHAWRRRAGQAEVDPELIETSLFVCDDRALAIELGALHGLASGPGSVAVELGDVRSGAHPGRTSKDEITIYGGVGLAFQDTIVAWQIYRAATDRGMAREIEFLA